MSIRMSVAKRPVFFVNGMISNAPMMISAEIISTEISIWYGPKMGTTCSILLKS